MVRPAPRVLRLSRRAAIKLVGSGVLGMLFRLPQATTPVRGAETPMELGLLHGRFYAYTGDPAAGTGYTVLDDDAAPLWLWYRRFGGPPVLGYPISQRFKQDGVVQQLFQRGLLIWRPDAGIAELAPLLDWLSARGRDAWLLTEKGIPLPLDPRAEAGLEPAEVHARRMALLERYPELLFTLAQADDAETLYGLPTSPVVDMGSFYAVRLQRTALQLWKVDTPWARAGEVTMVNAGEIAREAGMFDPAWLEPAPPPPEAFPLEVPVRVLIPAIRVDASVVVLGVTADGEMETPQNFMQVAWYNFGARPGEPSNCILSGHLDMPGGRPAVFYRLRELRPGHEIVLVGPSGKRYRYQVTESRSVPSANAPVAQIVGPAEEPVCTLITCDGVWSRAAGEYTERRIVRATLTAVE
jgi:sortase (surface protein transpeptidase)